MKPFLDIGKYQQEIILAVILACPIIGMLLLFGLGLSDATQQDKLPDSSIGQQQPCKRPPCNAEHSEVRHNRHAIKTGQIEQRLPLLQE